MIGGVDSFLASLKKYDKENIHPDIVRYVTKEFISKDFFQPDIIKVQSQAAAGTTL